MDKDLRMLMLSEADWDVLEGLKVVLEVRMVVMKCVKLTYVGRPHTVSSKSCRLMQLLSFLEQSHPSSFS